MKVTIASETKGKDVSLEDGIDTENDDLLAIRIGRTMEIISKHELQKALRAIGLDTVKDYG
jgi:hypothetical protein